MASPFRGTGHFETNAPNDPQMTLNKYKVKGIPYACYNHSPSPKFHSGFLYSQLFSS